MEKVCVLGLGYIGLPTAIVAAEHDLEVVGFDVNEQRVTAINSGDAQICEPEIVEKLHKVLHKKKLKAVHVIESASYFIIAVPTPCTQEKKADLSYVSSATDFITQVLKEGDVVILESTVPIGTTKLLAALCEQKTGLKAGVDFFVAHCPERVLPGNIFKELVQNARIIGGINRVSVEKAKRFYRYFVQGSLYLTDASTAEMVKLVENSSRDVSIAFAHQVASMASKIGLDPYEVIELANKHPRISILQPSCGVGGHCIAIDPWFLVETFPEQAMLLKTARTINDGRPYEIIAALEKQLSSKQNLTILILGLTYKPNVDDIRESPALIIANHLCRNYGGTVLLCEPHVSKDVIMNNLKTGEVVSFEEGIVRADIVISLVAHTVFKKQIQSYVTVKKIVDFCGLLHVPRQELAQQEQLFWPSYVSNNDNNQETSL